MSTMDDIDDLGDEVDTRREIYLRGAGWHFTSATPTFIWMWHRTLDGICFMVSTKDAWRIQHALETQWNENEGQQPWTWPHSPKTSTPTSNSPATDSS